MKLSAPTLLSFNGGYVDTAGFLVLQGLFAAHVTGNFVTLGASLAHGTSGAIAKLLSLPVFCLVVVATRLIALRLGTSGLRRLRAMLALKVLLLAAAAALAVTWGPFPDADHWPAVLTGMTLVCAMAIQNSAHRVHLPKASPSTLMTGTMTQIMLDVADLLSRRLPENQRQEIHARIRKMFLSVATFAIGCGAAALIFISFGLWVFLLPPFVVMLALIATSFDPALSSLSAAAKV